MVRPAGAWKPEAPRSLVVKRRPPLSVERPFARGTREISPRSQEVEAPLGDRWLWSLRLEYLVRNVATAGALEFAYRLGRAHRDFESLRRK